MSVLLTQPTNKLLPGSPTHSPAMEGAVEGRVFSSLKELQKFIEKLGKENDLVLSIDDSKTIILP